MALYTSPLLFYKSIDGRSDLRSTHKQQTDSLISSIPAADERHQRRHVRSPSGACFIYLFFVRENVLCGNVHVPSPWGKHLRPSSAYNSILGWRSLNAVWHKHTHTYCRKRCACVFQRRAISYHIDAIIVWKIKIFVLLCWFSALYLLIAVRTYCALCLNFERVESTMPGVKELIYLTWTSSATRKRTTSLTFLSHASLGNEKWMHCKSPAPYTRLNARRKKWISVRIFNERKTSLFDFAHFKLFSTFNSVAVAPSGIWIICLHIFSRTFVARIKRHSWESEGNFHDKCPLIENKDRMEYAPLIFCSFHDCYVRFRKISMFDIVRPPDSTRQNTCLPRCALAFRVEKRYHQASCGFLSTVINGYMHANYWNGRLIALWRRIASLWRCRRVVVTVSAAWSFFYLQYLIAITKYYTVSAAK